MAGTRLCIALIFAVELALLLAAAVWTGLRNDLVAQWWAKATTNSASSSSSLLDPSLWKIHKHLWNPPIGSSLMIGCPASDYQLWQKRVFLHPETKGVLIHPWLPNIQIVAVPPLEMKVICSRPPTVDYDENTDIAAHLALIDLFLCYEQTDQTNEKNRLQVFSDGSSTLILDSHKDKEPDLVNFLLPNFNDNLPLETCLDTRIRWEFVVANDGSTSPNSWQSWAHALNEARQHDWKGGWFPLTPSNQTLSASLNVQYYSADNWPRIRRHTPQLKKAENDTDHSSTSPTSFQYILFDDLKRHFARNSQPKSNEIPVYMLLSSTPEPIYFFEDESTLDNFRSHPPASDVPSLIAGDSSLWVSLPAGTESDNSTLQIHQSLSLIQSIRNWMTQSCLGWKADTTDLSGSATHDFRMGQALFWLRALRKSHEKAMLRAHEGLERYKKYWKKENQRLDDFDQDPLQYILWNGLGIRPIMPIAPSKLFQASMDSLEEAIAALKRKDQESATRLFLEASSSFQDPSEDSIPLFLDLSIDQYAAIFAPLLIPLVLPAVLTLLRETKRFVKKWKTKKNKTKKKED